MSQASPADHSQTEPADNHSVSYDPLLACLLLLTKLKDAPCSATSLVAGLPLVDECLTPELFVRAAERANLEAKVVARPLNEIASIVLPVVLLLENNQAVVLLEATADKQQAVIMDPRQDKQTQMPWSQLEASYTGFSIFVKHKMRFDAANDVSLSTPPGHWFWSVMKSSWRIYRDVLLASLFINLFVVASPLFVMNVYDRVVPNQALETLWVLAIGVIVVIVFDVVLKALRNYFIEVAGKKSDILLSAFLFERVLGARFSEKPASIGAFVSQFREFDTIRNFYTASTISALVDLPFVLLFLLLIFYVGGSLVWVPAATIPLIILYGVLLRRPMRQAIEQTFVSSAQKNATLVESLVGLETVKALGAEGFIQRTWEASVGHLSHWGQRMRMLSMSVSIFSNTVQQIASVVLIIVGVYLIVERELTMGALIACFMLTSRALGPIAQVASLLVSYDQTKTALNALQQVVDKTQERIVEKPFVTRPSFNGGIQFNQVDFTYPDDKQAALNAVSFNVKPGEKIGIIGRIGSGKSTIQKLLLGLYQPSQGSILLDGIDSQQIDPADLRRHIGYVPQDVVLFAGSIKANISYGSFHSDDEAIVAAAEVAGVTEFVNRHPLGFDRNVGERGQALSGGQRQSLGIARASLNNPSIYLFDEPTSGMDNSSETLVKENLLKQTAGKTVILVTHKTSLLSLVERLIVMDGGKIIADGPKEPVLDALKRGQLHVS
ncbi:MAG: type I secretion system permease/ATPase [Cellvibrionaceae bacterium]|nr:type I secretion system permease/ATPase [Cellvibrionaceae bacterium]